MADCEDICLPEGDVDKSGDCHVMPGNTDPFDNERVNTAGSSISGDSLNGNQEKSQNTSENSKDESQTKAAIAKSRDERLKQIREAAEKERLKKMAEIEENLRQAEELRMKQQEERKRKIEEMRKREEERRKTVEERRKKMDELEKERKEGILRRSRERESRIDSIRSKKANGNIMTASVMLPGSSGGRPGYMNPTMASSMVVSMHHNASGALTSSSHVIAFGSSAPRDIFDTILNGESLYVKTGRGSAAASHATPSSAGKHHRPHSIVGRAYKSPPVSQTASSTKSSNVDVPLHRRGTQSSERKANVPSKMTTSVSLNRANSKVRSRSQGERLPSNVPSKDPPQSAPPRRQPLVPRNTSSSNKRSESVHKSPNNVSKSKPPLKVDHNSVPSVTVSQAVPEGNVAPVEEDNHPRRDSIGSIGSNSSSGLSDKVKQKDIVINTEPSGDKEAPASIEESQTNFNNGTASAGKSVKDMTEEEYKAKMSEQRRLAREKMEREQEEERLRKEELRRLVEEERRKAVEEARRIEELSRKMKEEEEEKQRQLELQQKQEEEERLREEERRRQEAEREQEEKKRKEEEERLERKKRLESIMSRVKKPTDNPLMTSSIYNEDSSIQNEDSISEQPKFDLGQDEPCESGDLQDPSDNEFIATPSLDESVPAQPSCKENSPATGPPSGGSSITGSTGDLSSNDGKPKFKSTILQNMLAKGRLSSSAKQAVAMRRSSGPTGSTPALESDDRSDSPVIGPENPSNDSRPLMTTSVSAFGLSSNNDVPSDNLINGHNDNLSSSLMSKSMKNGISCDSDQPNINNNIICTETNLTTDNTNQQFEEEITLSNDKVTSFPPQPPRELFPEDEDPHVQSSCSTNSGTLPSHTTTSTLPKLVS